MRFFGQTAVTPAEESDSIPLLPKSRPFYAPFTDRVSPLPAACLASCHAGYYSLAKSLSHASTRLMTSCRVNYAALANELISLSASISEACNAGTVIDTAASILRVIGTIPHVAVLILTLEALIYPLKALNRLFMLIAKYCGIDVKDREFGHHKYQTIADVVSIILFTLATLAILGVLVSNPMVAMLLGWSLGLSGMSVMGYFDYSYQAQCAKKVKDEKRAVLEEARSTYETLLQKPNASEEEKLAAKQSFEQARTDYLTAKEQYINRRDAKRLFVALILGLICLLVCGSAIGFAPPAVVPILIGLKYLGITALVSIAVGRCVNSFSPKVKDKIIAQLPARFQPSTADAALLTDLERNAETGVAVNVATRPTLFAAPREKEAMPPNDFGYTAACPQIIG